MRTSMARGNDSKHHAPDELERIASWVIVFEAFFPSKFQPLSASMRISIIAQAKPSKEIEQKKPISKLSLTWFLLLHNLALG